MKDVFTKELGGVLLILTKDDRTYQVRRSHISSMLIIVPDDDTPMCSSKESIEFKNMYKQSSCVLY
jgi:hypothetical protein